MSRHQSTIEDPTDSNRRSSILSDRGEALSEIDLAGVSKYCNADGQNNQEIEHFVEQQGNLLDVLTERSRQLISENSELRKRIEQNITKLPLSVQKGEANSKDKVHMHQIDKNEDVTSQIEKIQEENDLLYQQSSLLAKELDNANQSISHRDKSLNDLNNELNRKLQLLKEYDRKLRNILNKKNSCEHELICTVNDLNNNKKEILSLKQNDEKNHAQKIEFKSRLERLRLDRDEFENESQQLLSKILDEDVSNKTKEIHSLRLEVKNLTRRQKDSEIISQLMIGNDDQINMLLQREDMLSESLSRENIRAEEASTMRDKLDAICSHLKNELKRVYSCRQKTARENIIEREQLINEMKSHHTKEVKSTRESIKEMNLQIAQLNIELDRCKHDKLSIEQKYSKLNRLIGVQQEDIKYNVQQLTSELTNLKMVNKNESFVRSELIHDKHILEKRIISLEEELKNARHEREKDKERLESEISKVKEENTHLREKIYSSESKADEKIVQLEQEIRESQLSATHQLEESKEKIEMLTCELNETKKSIISFRKIDEEQSKNHEEFLTQMVEDNKGLVGELEKSLSEERENGERLMNKNRELNKKYHQVTQERTEYHNKVLELELKSGKFEEIVKDADSKLIALGKELSECIEDQQQRIERERKLRDELRQTKMDLNIHNITSILDDDNSDIGNMFMTDREDIHYMTEPFDDR